MNISGNNGLIINEEQIFAPSSMQLETLSIGDTKVLSVSVRNNAISDMSLPATVRVVQCNQNLLASLDGIPATDTLRVLYAQDNQITNIQPKKWPKLTWIDVTRNPLVILDTSENPDLRSVSAYEIPGLTVDFAKNPFLMRVDLGGNNMPAEMTDKLLIDLAGFNVINGVAELWNNARSSKSDGAIKELESRGWSVLFHKV